MGKNRRMYNICHLFARTYQLEKAGWFADSVDLFELNEIFSAQSLAVVKELKIDPNKVMMIMLHMCYMNFLTM